MIPVEICCCQCTTVPERVTNLGGADDQSQRNDWSISPVSVVFLSGILKNFTGIKIRAIAYPEGYYDGTVINAVKEAGYEIAFAVQDKGLCGHEAYYSIPRIFTGLKLAENGNALFIEYVKNYKAMPEAAFKERWKPIHNGAN